MPKAKLKLAPDPITPAPVAGDVMFVLLPVTVRQRVPGGFAVTGSGLTRAVTVNQLVRIADVPIAARRDAGVLGDAITSFAA